VKDELSVFMERFIACAANPATTPNRNKQSFVVNRMRLPLRLTSNQSDSLPLAVLPNLFDRLQPNSHRFRTVLSHPHQSHGVARHPGYRPICVSARHVLGCGYRIGSHTEFYFSYLATRPDAAQVPYRRNKRALRKGHVPLRPVIQLSFTNRLTHRTYPGSSLLCKSNCAGEPGLSCSVSGKEIL
jgi:hypothetical protein